jgi:hypothetical protein
VSKVSRDVYFIESLRETLKCKNSSEENRGGREEVEERGLGWKVQVIPNLKT